VLSLFLTGKYRPVESFHNCIHINKKNNNLKRRIKMRLCRILSLSLLLCFIFPVLSNADQLEDAKAAIQNEEYKKAYELLHPLAEENNAEAQYLLGALYVNGQGVEKDGTKGLSWIMKAARQGYDQAKLRALSICLELANQGDAPAMYNVGVMCLNGWGGEQNTDVCIGWLESAAKNGHVRSAKVLSGIYAKGKFGITPDEEKASYWSNIAIGFEEGKAEDKAVAQTRPTLSKERIVEAPSISGPPEEDLTNKPEQILDFVVDKCQLEGFVLKGPGTITRQLKIKAGKYVRDKKGNPIIDATGFHNLVAEKTISDKSEITALLTVRIDGTRQEETKTFTGTSSLSVSITDGDKADVKSLKFMDQGRLLASLADGRQYLITCTSIQKVFPQNK
jgi:hypothetical protein